MRLGIAERAVSVQHWHLSGYMCRGNEVVLSSSLIDRVRYLFRVAAHAQLPDLSWGVATIDGEDLSHGLLPSPRPARGLVGFVASTPRRSSLASTSLRAASVHCSQFLSPNC